MAENYSLNSKFGFNITTGKGNVAPKTDAKEIKENVVNLFDNMTGYIEKYEDVFNGDVEKEINMYERQAMIVGMNLRAGEVKRNFDMNI